jgi:hypothetical protein
MVNFMLPESRKNIRVVHTPARSILREIDPPIPLVSHDMTTSQVLMHNSLNRGLNPQHENDNELSIRRLPRLPYSNPDRRSVNE